MGECDDFFADVGGDELFEERTVDLPTVSGQVAGLGITSQSAGPERRDLRAELRPGPACHTTGYAIPMHGEGVDGSGFLCESPGVFGTDRNGNAVPDFLNGGPYSDLDQQSTNKNGYGASLQVNNHDELFGHHNQLIAGFSIAR